MQTTQKKLDYIKQWRKENRDKVLLYRKRWNENNKEYKNRWLRHYYSNHREKMILKVREWVKKNPEKRRAIAIARYNRVRAGGKITPSMVREIREASPFCKNCGKPSEHLDHIIPVCRGGTNERSNLQMLCGRCNCRKATKERTPKEGY